MNGQPVATVIVPSYQSAATIHACLQALLKQDFNRPYQIIVVDSSVDPTATIVQQEFAEVQLIHLPQKTDPAAARNIGVAHAQAEFLAFIDSDCVAAPGWLSGLVAYLEQGYDAAGGAIANANRETLVSWAGYFSEFREFLPGGSPYETNNLTLGNAAYRRSLFEGVGGFPVGCFPQEDQLFHSRFCAAGGRIMLDPTITVAHHHRSQYQAFLRHQWQIGQANARVLHQIDRPGSWLVRHPFLLLLLFPALIALRFIRTLLACLHVEQHLILRQPLLLWLIFLGQCQWALGLVQEAFTKNKEQRTKNNSSTR